MNRRQISDQVLTWLFDNFLPDDFGLPRQHLFVIRRPGAGKPLCLITAATGRYCWSEDGKRRADSERPLQRKPSFEIIHGSKSEPHPMRHPDSAQARAA